MNFLKLFFLALAIGAVSHTAVAQQPVVGGGGVNQQIPQAPTTQRSIPDFPARREEIPVNPEPAGPRFLVTSLHVTGQTRFSEAELLAVTGFQPGTELDLGALRSLAAAITRFYNQNGYLVAQAYLPAQDIKEGAVTIAVIEGRYGTVSLDNRTNISDGVIEGVLDDLRSGDPVIAGPLERGLLIVSDMPGVEVRSTLAPGEAVGTSDLVVGVVPGQRVTGSLEADNWGNRDTGAYRLGAAVNLNEPLGLGDVLSARILASTSGGMKYGRISYQAQAGDGTLGVAYTMFRYRLGKQFASLRASGSEEIASLYGSYPVVRSYSSNLYVLANVDYRTFNDKVRVTPSSIDRQATVLIAGLSGDWHDRVGGDGWNVYSLAGTVGDLDIDNSVARTIDAQTARTNGTYGKLFASAARLQHVTGPVSLYGWVRGQVAFDNLDSSEKMELGGATGVRAYPEGEAYGDKGYIATLEARLALPTWSEQMPGTIQLIGFVDTGSVRYVKSRWFTGSNHATRSGVGVGLTWVERNDFDVTLAYGHAIGDRPATSAPDKSGRFWARAVKHF